MSTALKWKLVAGCLLVFIAGGMTGALVWSTQTRHRFLGPPHSGKLAHRMSERLRSQLELTPEQFAKIEPIIGRTAGKLETIRIETARRVSETMKEEHEQLAPYLTPEQLAKLKAIEKKHRRHLRHRGFPRSHRPEPP
jgi:Spy/CpxP family protein refolding chaperone